MRKETHDALVAELLFARSKFPGNRFLLGALMEESGELATAIMQLDKRSEVFSEAIQVAAVAIRIAEEGIGIFEEMTEEEAKP